MKKLFAQQFMGVIAALCTLILSVTVYAYHKDLQAININIENEKKIRKQTDEFIIKSLESYIKENKEDHDKFIGRHEYNSIINAINAYGKRQMVIESDIKDILKELKK